MTPPLKSQTIGAIRRFVSLNTSRDGLKELLLEAGADAKRILKISLGTPMGEAGYISASVLLNQGFDTIYEDLERPEADGTLLRMAGILAVRNHERLKEGSLQDLERGLMASNLTIAQITQATAGIIPLETAAEQSETAQLREVADLLKKGLRRLTNDRSGSITACTSAAESACRVALERLGLPLPASKQLPDYLVSLCQKTNIEALARASSEDTKKVFTSLRGLAQSTYQAAHQLGDRHAHGDTASEPSPFTTELLAMSCAALTTIVAGTLARNELKRLHPPASTA